MDTNRKSEQGSHQFPVEEASRPDWVGAWYAAPIQMQLAHLTGRTLYQIVHLHLGGRQIRLRFSNRYGKNPFVLSSVSVARSLFGLLQEGPAQPVFFQGQESVSIAAGKDIVSDPITLQVEAFT